MPCRCYRAEIEGERLDRLQRFSNLGVLTRLTFANLLPGGRSGNPANQEKFKEARRLAEEYAAEPRGWLVLCGPSGCGKTHLAAAIANYCLDAGRPALFVIVADFLDHLRRASAAGEEPSDKAFENACQAPLLILDDLTLSGSTPWAKEKLFQIINFRFNGQLPTVITLRTVAEDLEERFYTRLSDPALSRVCLVADWRTQGMERFGALDLELLREMTFESFDYRRRNLPIEQQENLERAYRLAHDFALAPQDWVVFLGTIGCGKTHLAAAIANYRRQQGKPAYFLVVPDFLDHLRSTFSPDSGLTYDELFERVKSCPLLILDDFGQHSSTAWAQGKLYQLVNHRYNARLPTVFTSSLSLEEIETRVSSRMADARLSTVFSIQAPDYRSDRPSAARSKPQTPRGRRRDRDGA